MPFIISKVNIPLTAHQEDLLKSELGHAIEFLPGKSEDSLMLVFEANSRLYLGGNNTEPMAYITVAVFGNRDYSGFERLSMAIVEIFQSTLGVDPNRVFIKYEEISAWSVAGQLFYDKTAKNG